MLAKPRIDTLFRACAEATQEVVLDAIVAADPMVGCDGKRLARLRDLL